MSYVSRVVGSKLEIICGSVIVGHVQQEPGFWVGQHQCRAGAHGKFLREQDAIDYVIGIDLLIDAQFEGRLEVAA